MDDGRLAPKVDQFLCFRIEWNSLPMFIRSLSFTSTFLPSFFFLCHVLPRCVRGVVIPLDIYGVTVKFISSNFQKLEPTGILDM